MTLSEAELYFSYASPSAAYDCGDQCKNRLRETCRFSDVSPEGRRPGRCLKLGEPLLVGTLGVASWLTQSGRTTLTARQAMSSHAIVRHKHRTPKRHDIVARTSSIPPLKLAVEGPFCTPERQAKAIQARRTQSAP